MLRVFITRPPFLIIPKITAVWHFKPSIWSNLILQLWRLNKYRDCAIPCVRLFHTGNGIFYCYSWCMTIVLIESQSSKRYSVWKSLRYCVSFFALKQMYCILKNKNNIKFSLLTLNQWPLLYNRKYRMVLFFILRPVVYEHPRSNILMTEFSVLI